MEIVSKSETITSTQFLSVEMSCELERVTKKRLPYKAKRQAGRERERER